MFGPSTLTLVILVLSPSTFIRFGISPFSVFFLMSQIKLTHVATHGVKLLIYIKRKFKYQTHFHTNDQHTLHLELAL
ncbi:hypothetical protein Hanom_Chr07g00640971 [Helianthus anomalus]